MSKLSNKYYKRVLFPAQGQKVFLEKAQSLLDINLRDFSKFVGVSVRSMNDWKREKYLMSLYGLERICVKLKIPLPLEIKIKDPFWYTSKGAKLGWLAVYKKYGSIGGNSDYRKQKWREWWDKKGQFNKNSITVCLPVILPLKSADLSEFVGIVLGDGSITKKQVSITLNMVDDIDFARYIRGLFKKIFNLDASLYYRKQDNVVNVVVSRTRLVNFLVEMGLNIGNKVKQQTGVPTWISESELFSKFCLRGLFDTDGCFYTDRHRYKDKVYLNCGMNFTNRSLPILNFFKNSLIKLGFHPTQKTEFGIFLRKENEIIRYFNEIGSSNLKHLNKFNQYFQNKFGEVPKWT